MSFKFDEVDVNKVAVDRLAIRLAQLIWNNGGLLDGAPQPDFEIEWDDLDNDLRHYYVTIATDLVVNGF